MKTHSSLLKMLLLLVPLFSNRMLAYQPPDTSTIQWAKEQQGKVEKMKDSYFLKMTPDSFQNTHRLEQGPHSTNSFYLNPLKGNTFFEKELLVILVSFSMPDQSLKQWLYQAHRIGGRVIIRGFVNDSFKGTILRIKRLLDKNVDGVQIAPSLFKQYAISQVPAVILGKGTDVDIVYGDVPLKEALGVLVKQKSSHAALAQALLNQLEEKSL